jgi:hypothetical protein
VVNCLLMDLLDHFGWFFDLFVVVRHIIIYKSPISHPDPLLNPLPLFYYMASKLEELKQKLLNQQALREKTILGVNSLPPQVVASAEPKEHEPGQVSDEGSLGPEEMMPAQRP